MEDFKFIRNKQIKVIQSRLKTRGVDKTSPEIREYLFSEFPDEELSEKQLSKAVSHFQGSAEIVVRSKSEINALNRDELVQQVASGLSIDLPIEEIRAISQQLHDVTSDRASLIQQIKDSVIAWVEYKASQDEQQIKEAFRDIEGVLTQRLGSNNQAFVNKSQALRDRVSGYQDTFRQSSKEVSDLFKIPG